MSYAVAFFGSTRFGFGNPEEENLSLGPSLHYNASFARNLFKEERGLAWKHFGTVASTAKSEHYLNGGSGGAYSYLLYAINPMGDPEMPLLTGPPQKFNNLSIYQLGGAFANPGRRYHCP